MKLEVWDAKTQKPLLSLDDVSLNYTINDVKFAIYQKKPRLHPVRQSLRLEPRGKALGDDEKISSLNLPTKNAMVYLRDLGPQIGWQTVFIVEYFGPFAIYPIFYLRPTLIYGADANRPLASVVSMACVCWSIHYAKRLLETLFVHRFSHATMPIRNLFKNCSYYWGFAAFIAYFVNHPLYTPATYGTPQILFGLTMFTIGELGNLSIHLALRNLRPPGTRERKIPHPTANPFTWLFSFVSCPNYTYEILSWLGFSVMTQSLPGVMRVLSKEPTKLIIALLFTIAGAYQMTEWALGKHRNYKKEFDNYPRRKAIIPFMI